MTQGASEISGTQQAAQPLTSHQCGALQGTLTPPGDKSISHRSVMLGGIAEGVTTVQGLLEGDDVLHTIDALRELGAKAERVGEGAWHITGVGLDGLHAPAKTLDMGNSGTAARLLIGLLSGRPFSSRVTGDASLCKRPMGRIMLPLSQMGATFDSTTGRLPFTVTGAAHPQPTTYMLPVPSAQVKSAILLAGLSVEGETTVIETTPTRDHSENMLRAFGANVRITPTKGLEDAPAEAITITGKPHLKAQNIVVPADISSAAFPLVAALIRPHSRVKLMNVGINPRRAGLITTLLEMGAKISLQNERVEGGEPVADLLAEGGPLHGVTVPPERAASMIDEYPILAMAAACATGETRMLGLHELRVKESDRLSKIAEGLYRVGALLAVEGDNLTVTGNGTAPSGGGLPVETAMDHRIAMSFLVLGGATPEPVTVDDSGFIATSFPNFVGLMNGLGMRIG